MKARYSVSVSQTARAARIFANIWSYGKRALSISLIPALSYQVFSVAAIADPMRPGSVPTPPTMSSATTKAGPGGLGSTNLAPGAIPASVVSSIINASGNTSIQSPLVIDFGNFASGIFNLGSNNFVNNSTIYLVSSNPNVSTATIKAQNIFNAPGSLLTTILPAGGLPGYTNLVDNLSLSLMASNTIANAGIISSAAHLTITAPQVYNAPLAGAAASATAPVMSAMENLNIFSPNITNAGTITSALANINVANLSSATTQSIVFNNMSGVLQALNGSISFRDPSFVGKFDTNLSGGDFLSKELNIFSGTGYINIAVNSISGQANLVGGDANISSIMGDLQIGAMTMSGDPTVASGGNIFLQQSQFGGEWVFADALTITAGGNIVNQDVSFIGTNKAGSGSTGSITMNAGGIIDLQTAPIISISTSTTGGNSGNISLTANGQIMLAGTISTHSTGGQAGDISITSNNGSVSTAGSFSVDSSAIGTNAGSITVSASTGISAANGITLNSSSDSGFAGSISITSQSGDVNLKGADGETNIIATSNTGTAGQVFFQVSDGNLIAGKGSWMLNSTSGSGGGLTIFQNGGAINLETETIDVSGANAGSVSILTTFGDAGIQMPQTIIKANAESASGNNGSVSISSGIFGPDLVTDDAISIGSIEAKGGIADFSIISLNTSKENIEVENITANSSLIALFSGKNVSVDLIDNDNPSGPAGSISVNANVNALPSDSTTTLTVNAGSGQNAVGSVSANGVAGGSIFAVNHGTGGIIAGDIVVTASTGNGGQIGLVSDKNITLAGSTYSANAGSSGEGGFITISALESIVLGDVAISAEGGGNNNGGQVAIGAPLIQAGNLTVNTSGHGFDGGSGIISVGGSTIISPSMTFTNNGAIFGSFFMGGDLQIGNLTVNANGGDSSTRSGGNIALALTGPVHGALNLNANGSAKGDGGSIEITSSTNLDLSSPNISIMAQGGTEDGNGFQAGNGGFIYLRAPNGAMKVDGSKINASGQGPNGDGGNIFLNTLQNTVVPGGDPDPVSGTVELIGEFNVDGSGTGKGGNIAVVSRGNGSMDGNVSFGNGFTATARGGIISGDGGRILILSSDDMSIDTSTLSVATRGATGNGGTIQLAAGYVNRDSGGVSIGEAGTLNLVAGPTLAASGKGAGNGGSIELHGATVNVACNLNVNAGTDGTGGTIHVESHSGSLTAGSSLDTVAISANGGTISGGGGKVELLSKSGIDINATTVSASARGTGDGGKVSLVSNTVSVAGDLRADADGTGKGGSVDVSALGNGSSIVISPATSGIFARGGSTSGAGGGISLKSDGTILLDGNVLNSSSRGSGSGGTIYIKTASTSTNSLGISGTLRADSAIDKNGGGINLLVAGGIFPSSSKALNISAKGGADSGAGGSFMLNAATINLGKGAIDVSAVGTGDGGSITITSAGDINAGTSLLGNGGETGKGGSIKVTAGTSNIAVGGTGNKVLISVQGGTKNGNGGQIEAIGKNLTFYTLGINANSRGGIGNGGSITMMADEETLVTGKIDVASRGTEGNGGSIMMANPNTNGGLTVHGDIDASSLGKGNAGKIDLTDVPNFMDIDGHIFGIGTNGDGGMVLLASAGALKVKSIDTHGTFLDTTSFGNGGRVVVTAFGDIDLGEGVKSYGNNGGRISINSEVGSIKAGSLNSGGIGSLLTAGGTGGAIDLQAGKNISADSITVSGTIEAAGVFILANKDGTGSTPFTIGAKSSNGIENRIDANGTIGIDLHPNETLTLRTSAILIVDQGKGGIKVLKNDALSAAASITSGGFIGLSSTKSITLENGISTHATHGQGANVVLDSPIISFKNAAGTDSIAVDSEDSHAGSIWIGTSTLKSTLDLKINAKGAQNGGQVIMVPYGGVNESYNDSLGTITISLINAGGPISIASQGFSVDVSGKQAGSIAIGGDPLFTNPAVSNAELTMTTTNSSLTANGTTTSGRIDIFAKSITNHSDNFVINALGIGSASGGHIGIKSFIGNLKIANEANSFFLDASGGTDGAAGSINITASDGNINLNGDGLLLNSHGINEGGQLSLAAKSITISNNVAVDGSALTGGVIKIATNALTLKDGSNLRANGTGFGAGGRIEIEPLNAGDVIITANGDISTLGASLGTIKFCCRPQTSATTAFKLSGSGTVTGRLNLDASTVNVNLTQSNGALTIDQVVAVGNVTIHGKDNSSSIVVSGPINESSFSNSKTIFSSSGSVDLKAGSISLLAPPLSPEDGTAIDGHAVILATNTSSAGDIVIKGDVKSSTSIELKTHDAGKIVQEGGILRTDGTIDISIMQGNVGTLLGMGTSNSPLRVAPSTQFGIPTVQIKSTGGAAAGQYVYVSSSSTLNIGPISLKGRDLTLSTSNGGIGVSNPVLAKSISLTAKEGNIAINSSLSVDDVTVGEITLTTISSDQINGDILAGSGGSIKAERLDIFAARNIGSEFSPLTFVAFEVKSTSQGSTYLNCTAPFNNLVVEESSAVNTYSLTTLDHLVGDAGATITVTGSPGTAILKSTDGSIGGKNGPLNISARGLKTDARNGGIYISNNSEEFSILSATSVGNISIGTTGALTIKGDVLANLSITLSTSSGSDEIVLADGVKIIARNNVSIGTGTVQTGVSTQGSHNVTAANINNYDGPNGTLSANLQDTLKLSSTVPTFQLQGTTQLNVGTNSRILLNRAGSTAVIRLNQNTISSGQPTPYTPIAFVETFPEVSSRNFMNSLRVAETKHFGIYSQNEKHHAFEGSPDHLLLNEGEFVIDARKQGQIILEELTIQVDAGTLLLIKNTDTGLRIVNLHDKKQNAAIIRFQDGNKVALNIGEELVISGESTDIHARRSVKLLNFKKHSAVLAEASLPALVSENTLVKKIFHCRRSHEQAVSNRVLKAMALIQMVRANRGAFKIE